MFAVLSHMFNSSRGWVIIIWTGRLPHQGRILAKEQFHNSYTFWAMPILIFSPVQIIMTHPLELADKLYNSETVCFLCESMNFHPDKQLFQVAGARDRTTDPWVKGGSNRWPLSSTLPPTPPGTPLCSILSQTGGGEWLCHPHYKVPPPPNSIICIGPCRGCLNVILVNVV